MDVWVKLYEPSDKWYIRKMRSIRWRVSGLLRKLKRGPSGLVAWFRMNKRCKELNKFLLAEAEKVRMAPKYPDPMPKDVEEFVMWAQDHGVVFDNRVTKVNHPRDSKYGDISGSMK